MTAAELVERIFREEHGRVLAALISQFEDFELAEDALQDAVVIALERWQDGGIPGNPGAWLTTVARRRAIDRIRHTATLERSLQALNPQLSFDEHEMDETQIPDDRLKLMFTCCHPSLALETQVALTLHTLGGLTTHEIARAFLVPEPTMAQRLARERAKIRNAGIPYRVPPIDLLPERLDALRKWDRPHLSGRILIAGSATADKRGLSPFSIPIFLSVPLFSRTLFSCYAALIPSCWPDDACH